MAQHTSKKARFRAVTANRLLDGEPVYLTEDGGWSEDISEARAVEGKEAADAALGGTEKDVKGQVVVNPYLFDVDVEDGATVPVSVREQIRARGPTIRLDLGKQAS